MYARGNDRQRIFKDDVDRRAYVAMLGHVVTKRAWFCLAYCLMRNHIHLLVETPEPDLDAGMHWLQGSYAKGFNRRHRRSGHLFQGRYGAKRVEDDPQLWMTADYIARNPVDAGYCTTPEEWRWSSQGAEQQPPWLASSRLRAYLRMAIEAPEGPD